VHLSCTLALRNLGRQGLRARHAATTHGRAHYRWHGCGGSFATRGMRPWQRKQAACRCPFGVSNVAEHTHAMQQATHLPCCSPPPPPPHTHAHKKEDCRAPHVEGRLHPGPLPRLPRPPGCSAPHLECLLQAGFTRLGVITCQQLLQTGQLRGNLATGGTGGRQG
jgi:hypothetical protein